MNTALTLLLSTCNVAAHEALDWSIVAARTCPHTSDMEQRLSKFADLIYQVSMDIPSGIYDFDRDYYSVMADYILDQNEVMLTFPHTIDESQAWFSYGSFVSDTLVPGMDGHTSWWSVAGFLDGGGANDPQAEGYYGAPTNSSFFEFLQDLPFGIQIVHGNTFYQCDEDSAWAHAKASVYVTEKSDDAAVCRGKTYVGSAVLLPTFYRETNAFGNDEWYLREWAMFMEMNSEREAQMCPTPATTKQPKSKSSKRPHTLHSLILTLLISCLHSYS